MNCTAWGKGTCSDAERGRRRAFSKWSLESWLAVLMLLPFAGLQCSAHAEEFKSHSEVMTSLHNVHRSRAGLAAQSVDENLSAVAQRWAEHMASTGRMVHSRGSGGEQIIAYSSGNISYEQGFRLWLGSSPHRAWLCSSGDRCGFGYAIGRNGCAYYAGAFAGSNSSSTGLVSYGGGNRRRLFFRRR